MQFILVNVFSNVFSYKSYNLFKYEISTILCYNQKKCIGKGREYERDTIQNLPRRKRDA